MTHDAKQIFDTLMVAIENEPFEDWDSFGSDEEDILSAEQKEAIRTRLAQVRAEAKQRADAAFIALMKSKKWFEVTIHDLNKIEDDPRISFELRAVTPYTYWDQWDGHIDGDIMYTIYITEVKED